MTNAISSLEQNASRDWNAAELNLDLAPSLPR